MTKAHPRRVRLSPYPRVRAGEERKNTVSLPNSPESRLVEYRRQARRLEAELDRLRESAQAAAAAGRTRRWQALRGEQAKVARELATVTASIAQLEHAARINLPRRTRSWSVTR